MAAIKFDFQYSSSKCGTESKPAVLKSPSLSSVLQGDDVPLTEQTVTQVSKIRLVQDTCRLIASVALVFYSALRFTHDSFRK